MNNDPTKTRQKHQVYIHTGTNEQGGSNTGERHEANETQVGRERERESRGKQRQTCRGITGETQVTKH